MLKVYLSDVYTLPFPQAKDSLCNFYPPRLIFTRAHWAKDNTSRGLKLDGGYQVIPVVQFDIRRPILLTREKQERKLLFQGSTLQI